MEAQKNVKQLKIQEKILREEFPQKQILVIGDVMVDEYVTGKVSRISPEAPIPVLNYGGISRIAGGAANVAHNLAALGAQVTVAGVIGEDDAGAWITGYLESKNINTAGFLYEKKRPTTVKRRFATKSQQLLRVDLEQKDPVSARTEKQFLEFLEGRISKTDAVVLSDYQKGVLRSPQFVRELIALCDRNQVNIAIDSKSSDIEAFAGATFVKPNNLELENAVKIQIFDEDTFEQAGWRYLERSGAKALIVTRGAKGISLFVKGQARRNYPAQNVPVYDVTGAGDTVISTLTLALASGMTLEDGIIIGNVAAGVVISQVGTVPVTTDELVKRLLALKEMG